MGPWHAAGTPPVSPCKAPVLLLPALPAACGPCCSCLLFSHPPARLLCFTGQWQFKINLARPRLPADKCTVRS